VGVLQTGIWELEYRALKFKGEQGIEVEQGESNVRCTASMMGKHGQAFSSAFIADVRGDA
jgi:hypothetical protein